MRIGIDTDHDGFELKVQLTATLKAAGHKVADFGVHELVIEDDYLDFVVPLAEDGREGRGRLEIGQNISSGKIQRQRAIPTPPSESGRTGT